MAQLEFLCQAIRLFKKDRGELPEDLFVLTTAQEPTTGEAYIGDRRIVDPWERRIEYYPQPDGSGALLRSRGGDVTTVPIEFECMVDDSIKKPSRE